MATVSQINWIEILVPAGITVIGWIAAFGFGLSQQRKNLIESHKIKIYEGIGKLHEATLEASSELSTVLVAGPPFDQLEFQFKVFTEFSADKMSEFDANLKTAEALRGHMDKLDKAIEKFLDAFMNLWRGVNFWLHAMPNIQPAITALMMDEFVDLTDHLRKLQSASRKNSVVAWRNWDHKEEIKDRYKKISSIVLFDFTDHLIDLQVIIHNALLKSIFSCKAKSRVPMDRHGLILTIDGFRKASEI